MNMSDKIACAGEPEPVIKVSGVRPMEDYKLWLRFNTGEAKYLILSRCLIRRRLLL